MRVRRGDSFSNEPGPYVEPVVLQVVCGRLWDALVKDDTRADQRIRLDDVTSLGNVDGALADFCDQQVQHASKVSGESEVVIREWIETELISDSGFRNQVLSGPGANEAAVLASLDSGHFLRPEWRRGTKWYENRGRPSYPPRGNEQCAMAQHASHRCAAPGEGVGRP